MSRKRHRPEEIVAKLRQVEVLTAQGQSVAEAIRSIGVTEVSSGTSCSTARCSTACFQIHAGRVHKVSALSNAFASLKSGVCAPAVKQP